MLTSIPVIICLKCMFLSVVSCFTISSVYYTKLSEIGTFLVIVLLLLLQNHTSIHSRTGRINSTLDKASLVLSYTNLSVQL